MISAGLARWTRHGATAPDWVTLRCDVQKGGPSDELPDNTSPRRRRRRRRAELCVNDHRTVSCTHWGFERKDYM